MFGSLKAALRGQRFGNDYKVKEMVHLWLKAQPKAFYFTRIRKSVQQCKKCNTKEDDCVEK